MDFKEIIRVIPDFPKKGIEFIDITTLLLNGPAFRRAIDAIAARYADAGIDLVVGPEARGFVIGAPVAYALGAGFVPVRKPGKLPAATSRLEYALEYRADALEIHSDAIRPGQRVLIVDDLLATGGTTKATVQLVERLGGAVAGLAFLVELGYLDGRQTLSGYDITSLITY